MFDSVLGLLLTKCICENILFAVIGCLYPAPRPLNGYFVYRSNANDISVDIGIYKCNTCYSLLGSDHNACWQRRWIFPAPTCRRVLSFIFCCNCLFVCFYRELQLIFSQKFLNNKVDASIS